MNHVLAEMNNSRNLLVCRISVIYLAQLLGACCNRNPIVNKGFFISIQIFQIFVESKGGENMIQTNELYVRVMNESDYPYMTKWLNDDLVVEHYGPRLTCEQVIAKYGPRINNEHYVTACIVEYKGAPIGYIQYYEIPKGQLKIYGYPLEEPIYGIDQFIGETGLWGKGIGTQMISALLKYLSSKLDASKVVLDVKDTNLQAIKCYEKCDFQMVKKLENNHLLMEWKKINAAIDQCPKRKHSLL